MFNKIKYRWNDLISDKKFSEILTGSAWTLSARLIAMGIGLGISVIIARIYGVDVLGTVAMINAFLMLTTIFTVLGTGTSLLRLIPEHFVKYSPKSAFKVYRKSQILVIAVSLVSGILFYFSADLIASKIFLKPHLSFYFALASICIVFKSMMLMTTQAIRGLRLIKIFSVMQILPFFFNIILLFIIGAAWPSQNVPVYAFLGSFVITGIVGFFIMEYSFRKKIQSEDYVYNLSFREVLTISFPMLMAQTMTFAVGQTGIIILGIYKSEEEVGYYDIAVKLSTLTSFILSAINSMAGPKFSELFHSNKLDELFYVAKKSAKLIFWTTSPILIGLITFGFYILYFIFGKNFTVAYPALIILIIGQFVHSISGATALFMNMTGNEKIFRNIVSIAALTNLGLSFILIPQYGIFGAAVAATITLSGWNIITLLYIKKKFGKTTGYFPQI